MARYTGYKLDTIRNESIDGTTASRFSKKCGMQKLLVPNRVDFD